MLHDHGGEPPEPTLHHRRKPPLERCGGRIIRMRQPRHAAPLSSASIRPKPWITGTTKGGDPKNEDLRPYNHVGRTCGDTVRVAAKGLHVKSALVILGPRPDGSRLCCTSRVLTRGAS